MRQSAAAGRAEGRPAGCSGISGQSCGYAAALGGDEAPAAEQVCHPCCEWAASLPLRRSTGMSMRLFRRTTELGLVGELLGEDFLPVGGPDHGDDEPGSVGMGSLGLALIKPCPRAQRPFLVMRIRRPRERAYCCADRWPCARSWTAPD